MMTICYLIVVTLAYIFGCGAGQTAAAPPEADIERLHLVYVTGEDVETFALLRQNHYVLTLSPKDPTSLNSPDMSVST